MLALGIIGTTVLWVFMIAAIARYWRDSRNAESLHAQIVTIKDDCETKIRAARSENDRLVKAIARKQDEFHERDERYRRETKALEDKCAGLVKTIEEMRPFMPTPLGPPPTSVTDNQIASQARAVFMTLSWAQRLALSMIYERPGILGADLARQLDKPEFAHPQDIVSKVVATNLIDQAAPVGYTLPVNPSPSPVIARAVRAAFREFPLWAAP